MNLRLKLLSFYMPSSLKRQKLDDLLCLAANSFGRKKPDIKESSYQAALKTFAQFTRDAADKAIANGDDIELIQKRLYDGAFRMGWEIRDRLQIKSPQDTLEAISIIYKILEIDFKGDPQGNVTIARCYFSSLYNEATCKIISALDRGMIAGVSDGWRLDITQRITGGHDCCRATLLSSKKIK